MSPATGRALRLSAWGAAFVLLSASDVPLCPVAIVARVPCPGCGLTRAAGALIRGHVREAVQLHPLSPIVVPIVGAGLLWAAIIHVREGRWPSTAGPASARVAVAGVALWTILLAVWIARFHGAFGGPVAV